MREPSVLKSSKPHIGIFGRRNCGKSSIINAFVGQEASIVSDEPGTTTDPVQKHMEIIGFGPVVIIDTAGIDDAGDLGEKRASRTRDVVRQVDMAMLVISGSVFGDYEKGLITEFGRYSIPYIVIRNKSDIEEIRKDLKDFIETYTGKTMVHFSALYPRNLDELVARIKESIPSNPYENPTLLGDILSPGDCVLLITPIDSEAPAGRLILPQVKTIRDCLDNRCVAVVLQEGEIEEFLKKSSLKPKLAVTDSQAFNRVAKIIPPDIMLTGFSILFARLKGDFEKYLEGTPAISRLKDNDRVLIMESCSHHVVDDDIGRVKLPRWISEFTGKKLRFDIAAGLDSTPAPVESYSLVIQCGGCMLTGKQVINRLKPAVLAGVPVSNYGMAIAYCHGIFERAVQPFMSKR